ncbi:MAG: hypothetical protein GX891_03890 [Clostridiales bacterium]|nr:hypothetical protein [Clostridiales bacterium]
MDSIDIGAIIAAKEVEQDEIIVIPKGKELRDYYDVATVEDILLAEEIKVYKFEEEEQTNIRAQGYYKSVKARVNQT